MSLESQRDGSTCNSKSSTSPRWFVVWSNVFRKRRKGPAAPSRFTETQRLQGRWDPLRVEQIVSNLLSNAVKYGEHKPIDVEVREDDSMVRLVVTDRGIGIEKDALSRIFDRFERAVSMRHFGGLGLGLFISRQIAEAHGGTIVARSQRGSGSTFTVILPRRPGIDNVAAMHSFEGARH